MQTNDYQTPGSGRARRDAAARAMQGWHAQRLMGYGEVGEPIIKVCWNLKLHLLLLMFHFAKACFNSWNFTSVYEAELLFDFSNSCLPFFKHFDRTRIYNIWLNGRRISKALVCFLTDQDCENIIYRFTTPWAPKHKKDLNIEFVLSIQVHLNTRDQLRWSMLLKLHELKPQSS